LRSPILEKGVMLGVPLAVTIVLGFSQGCTYHAETFKED
jgi:predicted esterase